MFLRDFGRFLVLLSASEAARSYTCIITVGLYSQGVVVLWLNSHYVV